jgi:deoxyribose-phosphate aldolase
LVIAATLKKVGWALQFGKDFMAQLTQSALAALIDHTQLRPTATAGDIERLCQEAKEYKFASVCVLPHRVNLAANFLHESGVKVCAVIGFPLGANAAAVKAMEAVKAVADGAEELDMVINLGALKDQQSAEVQADIGAVMKGAKGRLVKVILETSLLADEEIVLACKLSAAAGAGFVKTSTGFGGSAATVEHVRLMRKTVGDRLGVKASGGIRELKTLMQMIDAGATRIGTSSGVALMADNQASASDY